MKEWYTEYCKTSAHKYFVNSASLGAAKHRHDSHSDPAVQWVMTLATVQATAERATMHFATSEPVYLDSKAFLDDIAEELVFDMGVMAYRHCTPPLALGTAGAPLEKAIQHSPALPKKDKGC